MSDFTSPGSFNPFNQSYYDKSIDPWAGRSQQYYQDQYMQRGDEGFYRPPQPTKPVSAPAPTPIRVPYGKGQNPLGRFFNPNNFIRPGGGWSTFQGLQGPNPTQGQRTTQPQNAQPLIQTINPMLGGMPKDRSTAKQWYQQNPNKQWWQTA